MLTRRVASKMIAAEQDPEYRYFHAQLESIRRRSFRRASGPTAPLAVGTCPVRAAGAGRRGAVRNRGRSERHGARRGGRVRPDRRLFVVGASLRRRGDSHQGPRHQRDRDRRPAIGHPVRRGRDRGARRAGHLRAGRRDAQRRDPHGGCHVARLLHPRRRTLGLQRERRGGGGDLPGRRSDQCAGDAAGPDLRPRERRNPARSSRQGQQPQRVGRRVQAHLAQAHRHAVGGAARRGREVLPPGLRGLHRGSDRRGDPVRALLLPGEEARRLRRERLRRSAAVHRALQRRERPGRPPDPGRDGAHRRPRVLELGLLPGEFLPGRDPASRPTGQVGRVHRALRQEQQPAAQRDRTRRRDEPDVDRAGRPAALGERSGPVGGARDHALHPAPARNGLAAQGPRQSPRPVLDGGAELRDGERHARLLELGALHRSRRFQSPDRPVQRGRRRRAREEPRRRPVARRLQPRRQYQARRVGVRR